MKTVQQNGTPADERDSWGAVLELAAREVFSLMLGVELTSASEPVSEEGLGITSMVGLAGTLRGLLSLRCSSKSAALMASKMLGIDASSNGDEVQDAVGEVCNMVAGNFKNKIAGLGDGCQLSVPTVITGEDYCLRTLSNDCTIDTKFLFEGSLVIVSIRLNN